MNEYDAIQMLTETRKIFDRYNLEYWLDAGTLLGAVRDGKFIPWDEDMDLGTWHENIPKLISISNELRKKGFEVSFWGQEFVIKYEDCKLEVPCYRLDEDEATYPLLIPRSWLSANLVSLHYRLVCTAENAPENEPDKDFKNLLKKPLISMIQCLPSSIKKQIDAFCFFLYSHIGTEKIIFKIPSEYFTKLSAINFYGMTFNIPSNAEKFLTLKYGKTWKIPDEKWIYSKDFTRLALERERTKRK